MPPCGHRGVEPRGEEEGRVWLRRRRKAQSVTCTIQSFPQTTMSVARLFPQVQTRAISSSPYGRTHVWKRRKPVLPNPVVPKFPQRVIRADGSSFLHWTTSPRSLIRLTRDTTSNPLWNTAMWSDGRGLEEESESTGRLGRFNRRFEGIGGSGESVDWMEGVEKMRSSQLGGELVRNHTDTKKKAPPKKK
ncbi:hypothetical protein MIND_00546800 [Mycena indigotica]|uniref:Uncharacterized protein n=1 Tax=Mycena indigotica TaxID=2126181 RepID=A0A8H6SZA4_9AGAR|nr:uncharacterized protein MIND_00546800 [Mycena indigotica]KAF7307522.1 hypothetical protein MIND_00546800 [Mycena indigotica]